MPTYRVLVRGKFDHPDEPTKVRLRAEAAEFQSLAFSEEGSFFFTEALGSFTFRCSVDVPAGPSAEHDAIAEAEFKTLEVLERQDYPFRDIQSSATRMDDIKIRRR